MNLQTGFGLDSSVQGSKHYEGGVVDVSGGDVTFSERNGVIIRVNGGGDIVVDLVADPASATGVTHTLNDASEFPHRVRKIYQTGTTATGIRAIL